MFVDDSGRRCWIVRSLGRIVALAAVAFVVLSVVALTVSPSVAAPAAQHVTAPSPRVVAGDRGVNRP